MLNMTQTDFKNLTIKELRQRCQSTAPEAGRDPLIGYSIRFFSVFFTKLFLYTPFVTPLHVTMLSVILFLVGVYVFIFDILWLNLLGIFIVYVSILLDGTNGELARLKNYRAEIGARYIEPISHDIQYAFMFIPFMIAAYNVSGDILIVYIGFAATIGKLLNRFFISRFDRIREGVAKLVDTEGEAVIGYNPNVSFPHKVYRFLNRNFFSSVGFIIPLFIFTLMGRIDLFVWLFGVVYSLFALIHFLRQIRYVIKIDKPIKEKYE